MLKPLMAAAAVVALLGAAPGLAQNTGSPTPAPPAATDNKVAPTPAKPATTAEKPKFVNQQADKEMLASSLMGQTVYGPGDESLGDVNDLVFAEDGKIGGLVIGVGGFLGIGEKNVAISFDAIDKSTDENGGLRLTLAATADELNAAPAYVTLADLKAQQQQPAPASPPPAAPSTM